MGSSLKHKEMKKSGSSNLERKSKKQQIQRNLLADKLAVESKLVAKESMKVLAEFELLDFDFPDHPYSAMMKTN